MARHVLSPQERRAQLVRQMAWQQEQMSDKDIGKLMRKTARAALDRDGRVTERDFMLANVPAHAIKARGRAIIMEVVQERADGGIDA